MVMMMMMMMIVMMMIMNGGDDYFCRMASGWLFIYLSIYSTGEKILLTREEKERVFLDCIQSFYYSGGKNSAMLSDEQFNLLRNDLSWEVR